MKPINALLLILFLFTQIAQAAPLTVDKVPEPLKPWVDWVLLDSGDYKCPFLNNNYNQKRCTWSTTLKLELESQQGHFSSQWQVYKESWITLVGDDKHWPINVKVNGESALVVKHQGKPMVKLKAGFYNLTGDLLWDSIPENLSIPAKSGLITLSINGKNIAYPAIKQGSVWLKESDRGQKKPKDIQNKLDIQVFRQINDNVPLQLITYLELEVSGHQREVKLPHALLKDFIPIRLQSPLPAKIEANGSLSVQVRAGRWHIELHARHPKPLAELALNIKDKKWVDSEIWVFKAQPYQRVVEIENLFPIDPSQTNLPAAWKKLPAYQVNQGDVMKFKIIQRGDPEPEPNKLNLSRELWLDFDGKGYTIQDKINGKMTNGWRLDALPEIELGQVKLNGQNQLITQLKDSKQQGVEVRKGALTLRADSRFTGDIGNLSAVGWKQKFHNASAILNLPPGWRLVAASGVDNVPNSWISRWTLLDLFLVLIASLAISRLWNIPWGIFALVTLALIWHESGAPRFVWINIIAAIALIKVLPEGTFLSCIRWYRNACWCLLIIITIPFLVDQVRKGIYPQLEHPYRQITGANKGKGQILDMFSNDKPAAEMKMAESEVKGLIMEEAKMEADAAAEKQAVNAPVVKQRLMKKSKPKRNKLGQLMSRRSSKSNYGYANQSVNFNRIDPNSVVQTGLGAPQWHWTKVHLSWNGSVDSEQQMSLWLLNPVMTMLLNFIRVAIVVILSLLMFDLAKKIRLKIPASPLMLSLCFILLSGLPINEAMAKKVASEEFPENALLDELKNRLTQAPECVPSCAQISTMKLAINAEKMTIQLQIHTQQTVAIPLPAAYKQWFPNQVTVDGVIATAMQRDRHGSLWLNLSKGKHLVELSGVAPIHHKFILPLPLKPHHVTLNTEGWSIAGVHEHGLAENQLQFNRTQDGIEQSATQALEQGILPSFIRIERTLELGLDWRLKTRIIRLMSSDAAVVLELPLLKGESVISSQIRVKKGKVQVNMSANSSAFEWESILEKSSKIELIAAKTKQWTEVWRVDVSPIWHLQTEGISVVHHQDQQGHWLPEWRPWAGEKVVLNITRPEAISGHTLTIDNSNLILKPGKRSQEVKLKLSLRSSKGRQYRITLPEKAVLQSVLINNTSQPIRQKGRELTLPIKPAKQHIEINWQQPVGLSSFFKTPEINLALDSVNSHIQVNLGSDRWILFTTGPRFGPAILFWGVLIVIVIISIGLGRIKWTPLKHWQWFLLLIGLSQIPVGAALIVVAWLTALGVRAKKYDFKNTYFNAMQIGLALLTLISLILLFITVKHGLLGSPDMQIAGNHSTLYDLKWYQDRASEILPTATVISVPLMVYRILMLMWSLWLAVSLLNWLKWGWECFSTEALWKKTDLMKTKEPVKKSLLVEPENRK